MLNFHIRKSSINFHIYFKDHFLKTFLNDTLLKNLLFFYTKTSKSKRKEKEK